MLKECVEVFKSELDKHGESLILDSYIPADGTYLFVDCDGKCSEPIEIRMDKKTRSIDKSSTYFPQICFCDYHSQLISMNKPMDMEKIIHSNNFLSFFVKKDSILSGKLKKETIDGYYEVLKNPAEQKYKNSKEAKRIYEDFERREGRIDVCQIEKNKQWIKNHIFSLENVDMTRKDYLKIFFEADEEEYEREGRRYFLPNIYNNNDYNIEIGSQVYGLPDNNLGMNAKKPFLSVKSRKYPASYVLNNEEVLIQKKFFDYLMNWVSAGKNHIYVDTDKKMIAGYERGEVPDKVESGYYLRIKKGKTEAEIWEQDNITGYKRDIKAFEFSNIIYASHKKHPEYLDAYRMYYSRPEIERLISEVLFSNYLSDSNYYMDASEMKIKDEEIKRNILVSRDAIFSWLHKGGEENIKGVLDKISLNLIKNSVLRGLKERALWQINLRLSFEQYFLQGGEYRMPEIISELKESVKEKVFSGETLAFSNDKEYFYTVGQLAAYLLSLSKSKNSNQSLLNPILNAKTDEVLKKRLMQIYIKYNYCISDSFKRVKNMIALVSGYVPDGEIDKHMILLGYCCDSLIYMTKEGKENE